MSDDLDDMVENDTKKAKRAIQRYQNKGSFIPDLRTLMQNLMWIGAISSLVFLVAALPWVGQNKPIPGHLWIGLGTLGIVFFGGLGYLFNALNIEGETSMGHKQQRNRR